MAGSREGDHSTHDYRLEPVLVGVPIKSNMSVDSPSRERSKVKIKLISGGACNRKAFPDGEVTIYPWDISIDDWIVSSGKSQDKSLYEVIPKIADLGCAEYTELYIGDATTILLVSRSLRHGSTLEVKPTCTECSKVNKAEKIKIPDQLRKLAEKPLDWGGTDKVTLPDCKDVVEFRPLRVSDDKAINARSYEIAKDIPVIAAHIISTIVSVNGGAPDSVKELITWFRAASAVDQDFLNAAINDMHPRLDNEVLFKCDFCDEVFGYTLDLGKPFFRRPGLQRSS